MGLNAGRIKVGLGWGTGSACGGVGVGAGGWAVRGAIEANRNHGRTGGCWVAIVSKTSKNN